MLCHFSKQAASSRYSMMTLITAGASLSPTKSACRRAARNSILVHRRIVFMSWIPCYIVRVARSYPSSASLRPPFRASSPRPAVAVNGLVCLFCFLMSKNSVGFVCFCPKTCACAMLELRWAKTCKKYIAASHPVCRASMQSRT